MKSKITYQVSAMAAGMCISFVSMLLNSNDSYHIEVDSHNHTLLSIKKVFNIPDDKLTVSVIDKLDNNIFRELSDVGKFTSPYFHPEHLNIGNTLVPLDTKRNKPYIVLAMYQDNNHLKNYDPTDYNWPNNRYRSVQEYSILFQLIKTAGYEIITLDNHNIVLEDKIKILNDYVDCVIGYEGGLCHLAHVLKIPCIVLPWNIPETFLNVHALHLDMKTWFVHEFEDIKNWTAETLISTIKKLGLNQGNNIFAQGKVIFKKDFSEYVLQTNKRDYSMLPGYRKFEMDFFLENLERQQFFGKSLVFST